MCAYPTQQLATTNSNNSFITNRIQICLNHIHPSESNSSPSSSFTSSSPTSHSIQNTLAMTQKQEQKVIIPLPDLSTHVLDTSLGKPAPGIHVLVEKQVNQDVYMRICEGITDGDGRIKTSAWKIPHGKEELWDFGEIAHPNAQAIYRVTFTTKDYFLKQNIQNFLYPFVQIVYYMDESQHYHVPLLLSPFGYSTYRGS